MSTPTAPSRDQIVAAASALAAALPVPSELIAGTPGPAASIGVALPSAPGTAVLATVGGEPGAAVTGDVAVVVAGDLVEALRESPLGQLDVAAAVQPALDAAAAALGAAAAPANELSVDLALDTLLDRPGVQVVPLLAAEGGTVATALLAVAEVAAPEPVVPTFDEQMAAAAAAAAIPQQQSAAPAAPRPLSEPDRRHGLELLRDVEMEVTVELGRTRMTVRELLSLSPGAVVELDRAAGSPADLLVNGTLIARGEVVVVDEDFGIRITEIVGPHAGADAAAGGAA
ncbi:flagellar motor switch protein FliN [Vallicoccus soli]|uniref:Flagellar motor switch protein FliN n=1 Tax=Vallicoccus soli TaxID=2339232 RepID=A0A3A3YXR7_9ACTN|nr:flagellar motor switch protein FliN [Vallicoccus soli]RJK92805.1 flagellar motor switch protein FliN [Vallicoccus soli]